MPRPHTDSFGLGHDIPPSLVGTSPWGQLPLKDSGERQEFSTGAVRDTATGKGRFDLISPIFLRRLARVLEKGAAKYGERNWEKGQPLGRYLDSALRHINCVLLKQRDEDHAAQAAWNLHALIHTAEMVASGQLPADLDDIGYVPEAGGTPNG